MQIYLSVTKIATSGSKFSRMHKVKFVEDRL